MNNSRMIGAFAFAALAVVGCGPRTEKEPAGSVEFQAAGPAETWTCIDGQRLSVTFQAEPRAVEIATADGAQLMLPPTQTDASRYESEVRFFQVSGEQAVWKDADRAETTCTKE